MKKEMEKVNSKFAVIKLSGTQYEVEEGKCYDCNKLEGKKGDSLTLSDVLMVSEGETLLIGKPVVEGAKVDLTIDSQKKGEKVDVYKFKSKSRYRRSYGSRPLVTRVLVNKITY